MEQKRGKGKKDPKKGKKDPKKGSKLGQGVGALKRGGMELPYKLCHITMEVLE